MKIWTKSFCLLCYNEILIDNNTIPICSFCYIKNMGCHPSKIHYKGY